LDFFFPSVLPPFGSLFPGKNPPPSLGAHEKTLFFSPVFSLNPVLPHSSPRFRFFPCLSPASFYGLGEPSPPFFRPKTNSKGPGFCPLRGGIFLFWGPCYLPPPGRRLLSISFLLRGERKGLMGGPPGFFAFFHFPSSNSFVSLKLQTLFFFFRSPPPPPPPILFFRGRGTDTTFPAPSFSYLPCLFFFLREFFWVGFFRFCRFSVGGFPPPLFCSGVLKKFSWKKRSLGGRKPLLRGFSVKHTHFFFLGVKCGPGV